MSGGNDGGDAADASVAAAEIAADSQREALSYLKQKEAAPSFYSDQALSQLAGFYGLPTYQGQTPSYGGGISDSSRTNQIESLTSLLTTPDKRSDYQKWIDAGTPTSNDVDSLPWLGFTDKSGSSNYTDTQKAAINKALTSLVSPQQQTQQKIQEAPDQGEFIKNVMNDPFYGSMVDQGEEAILRQSAATGGLRSGTANEALAQNNQNVLQGLVNQRLAGLRGFTGGSGYEGQIASTIGNIGSTTAQGQIAAAQALAQGQANQSQQNSSMLGLAGTAFGATPWGAAMGGPAVTGAIGGVLGGLF